ncbi:hypothetical protein [Streptomyces scabiei]|uniref:hypothetical protein n=1 Tax=Streptomyces scabiei TaxID=1930 RepID=UPI000765B797|nr:hypothetical protein [Streptomyces scabiei]
MSFSLHVEGLVADVVEELSAADTGGDAQFEAARAFVLAELEAWPTEDGAPNGALVDIAGHADPTSRNATIVIRPKRVGPLED